MLLQLQRVGCPGSATVARVGGARGGAGRAGDSPPALSPDRALDRLLAAAKTALKRQHLEQLECVRQELGIVEIMLFRFLYF